MKRLILFALLLLTTLYTRAQTPTSLPQIATRDTVKFSSSYSCRSAEEFYRNGYEGTALFLTNEMKQRNSPDLVFNGACGSENYFQSGTHGGNVSLVADLNKGTIVPQLSSITSSGGWRDTQALKKLGFKQKVPVISGHTYAVLLNKHGILGLFVFTVVDFVPDRHAVISYEVLDYQITQTMISASRSSPTKKDSRH